MLSHVMVGTNDLDRAVKFYAALFEVTNGKLVSHGGRGAAFMQAPDQPMFGVTLPFDEKEATVGNGTMVSFRCAGKEQVDAMHEKALALGGDDEGAPGPRGDDDQYYGAYFRDPDGNKLAAFTMNG